MDEYVECTRESPAKTEIQLPTHPRQHKHSQPETININIEQGCQIHRDPGHYHQRGRRVSKRIRPFIRSLIKTRTRNWFVFHPWQRRSHSRKQCQNVWWNHIGTQWLRRRLCGPRAQNRTDMQRWGGEICDPQTPLNPYGRENISAGILWDQGWLVPSFSNWSRKTTCRLSCSL